MNRVLGIYLDAGLSTERTYTGYLVTFAESGNLIVHKTDGTIETIKAGTYKYFGVCLWMEDK